MAKAKTPKIVLGIVSILIFIGLLAGCYYLYDQNTQKSGTMTDLQTKTRILEKRIKELPQKRLELAQMETEESRLAAFIPTKESQAEFVMELENVARQSGVNINRCEIVPQVVNLATLPQYQVFQWKLTVTGNYRGLNIFFKELPLGKRAAMMSNLNLTSTLPDDKEKFAGDYLLKVELGLDLISNPTREKVTK